MGFASGIEGTGPVLNRSVMSLSETLGLLPRYRSGLENMYESDPRMTDCSGDGLRAVNVPEVANAGVGDFERARWSPWTTGKSKMAVCKCWEEGKGVSMNRKLCQTAEEGRNLSRSGSGASIGSLRSSQSDGKSHVARTKQTNAS
jgi:hypothetical protein